MILAGDAASRGAASTPGSGPSATVPRVHARVAGNEAIVAMVALGLGVGVVPRIVLDNSPLAERVRELPTRPAFAPYEVGLVTLARHLNDPLVAAFWALADDGATPRPGERP